MRDPISPFSINCHSSIRWGGAVTVWFDPFRVEKTTGDGDVIFITHDIGLAYYVSDNVYIMEHGKFVESGPAEEVILHPTAAYTKRLISDVPKIYEPWDLTTV